MPMSRWQCLCRLTGKPASAYRLGVYQVFAGSQFTKLSVANQRVGPRCGSGIDYAKISVVMQPANYRFSASEAEQQQGPQTTVQWLLRHVGMVQNMVGVAFISLIVLMFVGWFYYRRR